MNSVALGLWWCRRTDKILMTLRSKLTKQMAPILERYGYTHKSGMFIKDAGEIAALIDIHKYTTGEMIEIDVGVGPKNYCNVWPPKWSCDLGVRMNTNNITELRDHPVFRMLFDAIEPTGEELEQAIVELADWIDATLLDEQKLRSLILDERSFLNNRCAVFAKAQEWARQESSSGM